MDHINQTVAVSFKNLIMQADIYKDDIAALRSALSAEGIAALKKLDFVLREQLGRLTGPTLAYLFSAGPVDTLDDVIQGTLL